MSDLASAPEWAHLAQLYAENKNRTLNDRFESDPARFDRYHLRLPGLLFDYSKHPIDDTILSALCALARARGVESAREALFSGAPLNTSGNRPVLHTALRRPRADTVMVDGHNVMPNITRVLDQMAEFSAQVRNGSWRGYTNQPITDIVNIGIGGSDLGPVMACGALEPYTAPHLRVHFVSNVDGAHLTVALKHLNPATTLFLISSKSFTTQETMVNAHAARGWFLASADEAAIPRHFVAMSTNAPGVAAFGIALENMFPFWDWVGGRYSIWSSIGLSLMLMIGPDHFRAFLNGAYAMDQHFQTAPLERNMPFLMALIGIWHHNFYGSETLAVLPYDQRLARLPAYLQQLEMESNGKSVTKDGAPISYTTAPIIFGEPGTNGQHSFYQLIHQGTHKIPCDFIGVITPDHPLAENHQKLLAHALAQPQALMQGRGLEASGGNPANVFRGNHPSSFMLIDRLDPFTLGQIIAAYEHKVFVQGVIWDINSFDQPGVELGKTLAQTLLKNWESGNDPRLDSSTRGLLSAIRRRTTA